MAVGSIVLIFLAYSFGSIVLIVLPDGSRLDCTLCLQMVSGSIVLIMQADSG